MAGTTQSVRDMAARDSMLRQLLIQFNKVVDDLETLRGASVKLVGSATYDPGNLLDGAGATTTVTVTGAALGDFAEASFSLDLQGITLTAWVSATNTVSVRFQNETGGALDLASGTLRARVTSNGALTGAAADLTAAKIADLSGTAITA